MCPASNEYVLGAPLFKRVAVHLENGKTFTVEAPENNHRNIYIGRMMLNGNEYGHNFITHETLTKGARIEVQMTPQPNLSRGTADEDAPYSFSKSEKRKTENGKLRVSEGREKACFYYAEQEQVRRSQN